MHTIWSIPELVHALKELSQNYWWSWAPDGPSLFRDLDPELWESSHHNARRVLESVPPLRLAQVATDPSYVSRVERLVEAFRAYRDAESTWASRSLPGDVSAERPVAYFCAEFGIHESLPIYSGGLGLLAGDHLKSASDLGVPLVGVGLLYREGFFHQRVTRAGEQVAYYVAHDFRRLPMSRMERDDGTSLLVRVPFPGRELAAAVWRVDVGRVPLYLLDADVPENSAEDRWITARLYGGDHDTRVRQEVLLGVGGVRALRALGIDPGVYHLNEGHSAFLTLELARERVEAGETFAEASAAVRELAVFTTHTPVPAGHDAFSSETVDAYLGWLRDALGISQDELMALGAEREPIDGEPVRHGKLGMTPLAIRMSRRANGVSAIHGAVSRSMWHGLFPTRPVDEVPISHVTNGVHARSWIAPVLAALYDRHLGTDWPEHLADAAYWERAHDVPDEELWTAHQNLRERLVAFARHRVARIALSRGDSLHDAERAYGLLDPRALTIGFARRFASYKRGDLLFHDVDRLAALLGDPERPVQVLFAGKSHPNDGMGKDVLRNVVRLSQDPRFARWIVFLEDYDIAVARHLVRGVDVWLNNPRRPQEASGTSGEKAALNGALNLSVLDGWWCEGYTGDNGWAIGGTEAGLFWKEEDRQDAESLYSLLEERVIPLFYDRPAGIPRGWVHMMKRSIETLTPVYNTDRMVAEYAARFYTRQGALASR